MKTARILITPASQGGIGDLYNKLAHLPDVGLWFWGGGNSISENVEGPKHLIPAKKTTVAKRAENMLWHKLRNLSTSAVAPLPIARAG